MNWLRNAGIWLLAILKPIGKGIAVTVIQHEGDVLQSSIRMAVSLRGPKAIDIEIDKWQDRLISGLQKIKFLPLTWKDGAAKIIQQHGDELQDKLKQALSTGGLAALDLVFDTSQAVLIQKLDTL